MTRDLDGTTPLMATMQNIQVVAARKQQSLSASGAHNVPYFERPFSDPIGPDTPPLCTASNQAAGEAPMVITQSTHTTDTSDTR